MLADLFENRLFAAILVVIAVPVVLVGYIVFVEWILKRMSRPTADRARPWLWMGPALLFLGVFLVYPTIATVVRSFQNRRGDEFIGVENYQWFFGQSATIDARTGAIASFLALRGTGRVSECDMGLTATEGQLLAMASSARRASLEDGISRVTRRYASRTA